MIFSLKFNKRILERVPRLPISDDLTRDHFSKPRKYNFKVFALSYLVELANEEDVLRRLDVSFREVI